MDIIKDIPVWPFTIIAALIAALVMLYIRRMNRTSDAKDRFRQTIFDALSGIYPSSTANSAEIERIIQGSAHKIADAYHAYTLTVGNNCRISKSVSAYKDAAKNYSSVAEAGFQMYPTMRKSGQISPKAKVIGHIEILLKLLS